MGRGGRYEMPRICVPDNLPLTVVDTEDGHLLVVTQVREKLGSDEEIPSAARWGYQRLNQRSCHSGLTVLHLLGTSPRPAGRGRFFLPSGPYPNARNPDIREVGKEAEWDLPD